METLVSTASWRKPGLKSCSTPLSEGAATLHPQGTSDAKDRTREEFGRPPSSVKPLPPPHHEDHQ